jgi:Lectin C-type domain
VRTLLSFCALAGLVSLAHSSAAAPIQWSGNGHYYEYIEAPLSPWTTANAAANSLSFAGLSGHLATITSAEENAFVVSLTPEVQAVGNEVLQAIHLGAYRATIGPALTDGWAWVTGEPFTYTNWAPPFEPNNFDEPYLAMWMVTNISYRARGTWNDATNSGQLMAGYVVEYDEFAVPEPAALPALAVAALALLARGRRAAR